MRYFLSFLFFSCILTGCRHTPPGSSPDVDPDPETGYPKEIGTIFTTKCASAGCHNNISYPGAGGVNMTTWEKLFEGGSNGAVIIPYNPENSSLLYFINTNELLGPTAKPVMPYDPSNPMVGMPLSQDDYMLIRDWVAAGAPDKNGNIPFAAHTETKQKIYITMQGCDQVAVVDAASRVVMRYINVGRSQSIESPHCIRMDSEGRYAYVSFIGGEYLQKIDTYTDTVVADFYAGPGSWNILGITPDDKYIMMSDWSPTGKVILIDASLENPHPELTIPQLSMPHGIACLPDHTFLVTSEAKNVIYKIRTEPTPSIKEIPVGDWTDGTSSNTPFVIHEIMLTPDLSRYFITCQNSGEVRVMDTYADTLIRIIKTGYFPQEIALSKAVPYLFVTCMEDASNLPGFKGSVYAINYETYETKRIDGPFYQPHGITVDDLNGVLYVASSNADTDGPAPHHASSCAGRNGYYNVYDLYTLDRLPKRYEVTVQPYSAATRFW